MKRLYNILLTAALILLSASCNEWLNVMPDNRAEVDSVEKVNKLLVSAYPEIHYIMVSEWSSDNVDDFGKDNPNSERILEEIYAWKEVTTTDNEDPKSVWEGCYGAITNANQALQSIKDLGNPAEMDASRGEALLCRAYCHFVLVNIFCKGYDPATADTDLGIPYMDAPETELNPKYERGTVADVYEKISKDLEEGLELIDDSNYAIQKYHFNEKAAYTFASRFYLFYGMYEKAIECADYVLGSAPADMLRDYNTLAALPQDEAVLTVQYNSTNNKNNLLVHTGYSGLGIYIGPYYTGKRHTHGHALMVTEVLNLAPWGKAEEISMKNTDAYKFFKLQPMKYAATNLDFVMFPRIPYLFEYVDPVAQTGYHRTNLAVLTADEALLNRAEANILLENYDAALNDINLWTANTLSTKANRVLTEQGIVDWANGLEYYTSLKPTPKKRLNPLLLDVEEGSKLEAFLHAILYIRRIEFMHMGMRWFDIKRYGIEITRRTLSTTAIDPVAENDVLTVDDERRAIQLPSDVISAGLTPNPRP